MSDEIHVDNVSMSSENQSFQCTQLITKALDEKGWKYDIRLHDGDTERDRIYLSFNADNLPTIRVLIVCDEHGRRVSCTSMISSNCHMRNQPNCISLFKPCISISFSPDGCLTRMTKLCKQSGTLT